MKPRANLVIAGVNKAGTTSLFTYLAVSPQVLPSSVKETCHFLGLRYGEPVPPIETYERYFRRWAGEPVVMEATPGYFYGGDLLAAALDRALPEVRILLVLREPVDRLMSFFDFQHSRLALPKDLTLSEYVGACRAFSPTELGDRANNPWFGVEGGRYGSYLCPWLQRFGGRCRVLFFDDLKATPKRLLTEVASWLSIDAEPFGLPTLGIENQALRHRSGTLQRMALAVNDHTEPLLRRHPALKRRLRRTYRRLNSSDRSRVNLDPGLAAELSTLYAASDRQVAELLSAAGYASLPEWLAHR